jgi:hypothetical protein
MSIRIVRNEQGNCINFYGSSNPTYWNACLSAQVDDTVTDTINVINDIITSQTGVTKYEFYQIPFGEFTDRDGNAFSTAQEAADYITDNANVIGLSGVGTDLNGETVCFRLDDTSTSIMLDNGYSYGVNTIKAIPDTDGTIHIKSKLGDITHFTGLEVGNACLDGNVIAGGLNDISNTLNELFTVGPFEAVVISDPEATVIADVNGVDAGYTLVGSTVVDPVGDDIAANSSSGNYAGVLSTHTINQSGEYFTFDIREEGQIGFGLVHSQSSYDNGYYSGSATYANPTTFGTANNAHYGFQFSHWFHPTPNGSWTNYGANTSYVTGSGWSNWESQDEWLAGEPVKIKVGIDENGFIAISSLQDDGTTWILHARTAYPVADGGEYRLGIKFAYPQPRLLTAPKVHLRQEDDTPEVIGDSSVTVFGENISGTLAGGISYTGSDNDGDNDGFVTSETISQAGEYFEFTWTDGDANCGLFSDNDHAVADLDADRTDWGNDDYIFYGARMENDGAMNNEYNENDLSSNIIEGEIGSYYGRVGFDSQGRATVWASTDGITYTVKQRLNSSAPLGDYRFIWIAQDANANITEVTKGQLSIAPTMSFRYIESPDGVFNYPLFATEEEANYYDSENGGSGTSHTHTYADDPTNTTWYMPDTNGVMDGTFAPAADLTLGQAANYTEITSLTNTDLAPSAFSASDITQEEGTNVNIQVTPAGATWSTSVSITPSGSGLVYDGYSVIQGTLTDVGADTTYTISVTRANSYGSTTGTMTVTATDVAPVQTNTTPWTKALDFSGSNEHAKQVSPNSTHNAIRMGGLSVQVPVNADSTKTTNDTNARPWACAVVFKSDNNSANQHIWNSGEGTATGNDNIYLRVDASSNLYFGWGREGSGYNECRLAQNISSSNWYGVYIAHKGYRPSAAAATSNNLPLGFDIRLMSSADSFNAVGSNLSVSSNWTSTGARMDRSVAGDFTIGGRGSNRNFHGKVASMVVCTLRINIAIPTDAEIKMMITDPKKWEDDYRDGQFVRWTNSSSYSGYTPSNQNIGYGAVQIWLMGDGSSDSYANGIRNEVYPSDQNHTKMQLNSMVSNDIQTVSIAGLS